MGEMFTLILKILTLKGQSMIISVSAPFGGATEEILEAVNRNAKVTAILDWTRGQGTGDFVLTYDEEKDIFSSWDMTESIKMLTNVAAEFQLSGWTAQEIWSYRDDQDPLLANDNSEPKMAPMRRRMRGIRRHDQYEAWFSLARRGSCNHHANDRVRR